MNRPNGWAVYDDEGEAVINTVAETRRGAIVNWLVVVAHVQILNRVSDQTIQAYWEQYSPAHGATVSKVHVTKADDV